MKFFSSEIYYPSLFLLIFIILLSSYNQSLTANPPQIKIGLDVLMEEKLELISGKKVGVITNQTGIDSKGNHVIDLLFEAPGVELTALFGPEHGIRGDVEGGFKIKVDRKKFLYNIASEKLSIFFKNIVSPPRPDYIMVCGNNVAIGDAKYKYKISISDVERVIAYIIDYSRPQIDNGQEIKGFIIMLKHEHITPLLAQRLDMTPQLKIYVAEADPRNPLEAKIKIRNICNKVFK